MNKPRIFSGIQPSGNLHIGNYLGAIKNWVKLQDQYDSIFCVVDMHAITVPQDPAELRRRTIEVAKVYLASGIDPKKSTLFIQSHISEHAELAWILNTIAKIPELEKMTQFKDKAQKAGKESASVGLFDYPILMASDILLYDTELVPVGKDQLQHIELTRTLAERFNKKFGKTFIIPKAFTTKESENIMGLDDPTKKMSKSASSEYNYIALTDDEETVRRKIKKAVTDSGSEIVYNDSKPALKNLINIYSLLSEISPKEIENKYVGKKYSDFKNALAEVIINYLTPFQKKMAKLTDEKVLEILEEGAKRVRPLAQKKLREVKKKIGFVA
ncbi:MAG: tryptophan--tRNA ligase [Candidatus Moranbacteria bacterium RIFOXYA12_FULL_35_19]|nr:MAG: Tryptophan-tRNA ligase [Candidatus Moranbacteria bacterium GW2011_GWF2_35_39]OGI32844.1 MAG: tryptophan--tRNA ligase [Candidatus Moranbacteria bacterium RIFOXYC12_FULL_36_13]OGI32855.1 MAG: tryptophan--tRNA ligase [Candidatus Moranbacteria bacterium RIFOXYB12_FULL_35_8]OGI36172.1 MAG: tryptophan--tRNA ligase [Candidatus Moranbacteria bacterium RIFOXYA12_FULL_35_19]